MSVELMHVIYPSLGSKGNDDYDDDDVDDDDRDDIVRYMLSCAIEKRRKQDAEMANNNVQYYSHH